MTEREWQRAWEIFRTARELPGGQRTAWLASLDTSPGILDEVRAMLDDADEPAPSPKTGARFAHYEIQQLLGSGGMGLVYCAYDLELDRKVALKFLSPERAASRAAVEKLVREAKAASALNHPHIVTVYEVIRSSDDVAIAMELVEGSNLRSVCGRPHDAAQVVEWGRQIAQALAAAHRRNIVHRDIKPENLMLREDGILKVLDFGLARHAGPGTESRANSTALLAGTLNYMSPEQTRAEPATGASDIFALGIVLYELAAGAHPFGAGSPIDTAYAIAHTDPAPPSSLNPRVPAPLNSVLRDMLAKDAALRPSADDVDRRLSEAMLPAARPLRLPWRAISVAALLLATLALVWQFRPNPVRPPTPRIVPFTTLEGSETDPSFSPDGSHIAFTWNYDGDSHIYVKPLGAGEPVRLTTTAGPDSHPAWSPDGFSIAFLHGPPAGKVAVMLMPSSGGDARQVGEIQDTEGYPGPIAWMPDGKSLVVRDSSPQGTKLFQLSLISRERLALTASKLDGHFQPSPDGRLLALERHDTSNRVRICVYAFAGGSVRCLQESPLGTDLAWAPDSQTLYFADRSGLWRTSVAGGPAVKLADGRFDGLSIDRQGRRLAFSRSYSDFNIWRIGSDGKGAQKLIASSQEDSEPEYSPSGGSILFRSTRSGNYELWVSSKEGANPRQITSLGGHLGSGRWSPDGQQIVFDAMAPGERNAGIYVVPAAGGAARRLTTPDMPATVPAWSHDGRWVYFEPDQPGIWKIPAEGGTAVRVSGNEALDATESADSRFFYYRKGRANTGIWREPLSGGAAVLVPGTEPVMSRYWQLLGDRIYFVNSSPKTPALELLDLATHRTQRLAALPSKLVIGPRGLTVSPDGRSILYTCEDLTLSDILLMEDFR